MTGGHKEDTKKYDFTLSEMTAENVSWGVDLMHKDCAKLQFLREFTENAIQAIEQKDVQEGTISWTYDRLWFKENGSLKATIIDNGIGMTGREISKYINKIFSSGKKLGLTENYGIGAKIAAAPLNHRGIEYWTWKDGVGYLAVLRMKNGRYGLEKFENDRGGMDDWLEGVSDEMKPKEIDQNGVKVVLLGMSDEEDTYFNERAEMPTRWILRYLNSRYFEIPEGVAISAPSIRWNEDGSLKPMKYRVRGMKRFLNKHIEDESHYGKMDVHKGTLHWWLLDTKDKRTHYTEFNSHAQSGAIFQNEMYDVKTMQGHRSRMQKFSLIFTYDRVAIFIEPNCEVRSNTARSSLLMEDETAPPWEIWSRQFSDNLPEPIRKMEEELYSKSLQKLDSEIKERIRKWFSDQPLSRFQAHKEGDEEIDEPLEFMNTSGGEGKDPDKTEHEEPKEPRNRYSDYIEPKERRAKRKEIKDPTPDVIWKTRQDATRMEGELEDRAAEYLPGNDVLNINGDFRVYTDLLEKMKHQKGAGDPSRERAIETFVKKEYTFSLLEATMRTKLLNDNPNWSRKDIEEKCLSPEGLTESVMSNYHLHFMLHQNMGRWISSIEKGEITIGGKKPNNGETAGSAA